MILKWKIEEESVVFFAEFTSGKVPLINLLNSHDTLELPDGKEADTSPLMMMIEEDKVTNNLNGSISVNCQYISELTTSQLRALGLPERMPFSIEISADSIITQKSFRFKYDFLKQDTSLVIAWKRTGCMINVGKRKFVIPHPIYELVKDMDLFNQASDSHDMKSKFLIWADLKEKLPQNAIVDQYLSRFEIKRADAFTLLPEFDEKQKQLGFSPKLLKNIGPIADNSSDNNFESSLPEARQTEFQNKFKMLKQVNPVYAMNANVYCVLSKELQTVLEVVKTYQSKSPSQRMAFIKNPRAFITKELTGQLSDATLEEIFQETDEYSDRVKEVGIWSPPIIPFLKSGSDITWIDPTEVHYRIGELELTSSEILALEQVIIEKIDRGEPYIIFKDSKINTIDLLNTIEQIKTAKSNRPETTTDPSSNGPKTEKLSLSILRNLENEEFKYYKRIRESDTIDYSLPSLKTKPMPHQLEAIKLLQKHWCNGSPGMLIADDMGLGKTFQTLVFMDWLLKVYSDGLWPAKPFLLVAPTGLIGNWVEEADKHLKNGSGNKIVLTGSNLSKFKREPSATRHVELLTGFPALDIEALREYDWVITTYENIRDYQFSFAKINWGLLVFDEMQKIKNPKSMMTDAAKALKADFIIGLTGTPVENKLVELWCIIDTIYPGFLGSLKHFARTYESSKSLSYENIARLHKKLTSDSHLPIMLRRLKKDHLQGLPDKIVNYYERPMGQYQTNRYSAEINVINTEKRKKGDALKTLQIIRAVSLHPEINSGKLSNDEQLVEYSARIKKLVEIIDKIKQEEEKALIFCETLSMQEKLSSYLHKRYKMNSYPIIINGSVSGAKRQEKVNRFQNLKGFSLMILSPKAGGVGLTLTAANHVIHLTRWWNPAVEDQCTDRVFRIGQKKCVNVYYPIAVHPSIGDSSFDLLLDKLLKKKREQNTAVLAPTSHTKEDLNELLEKLSQNNT